MAAEGYVVLVVDLYDGEVAADRDRARELASNVRNNPHKAIENMRSAVSFLREHDSVMSDRIASLGWCFGGGMSLQLALNDPRMAATGIYYGSLVTEGEKLSVTKWSVLGIFGSADASIQVEQVREFENILMENNVESGIYICRVSQMMSAFVSRDNVRESSVGTLVVLFLAIADAWSLPSMDLLFPPVVASSYVSR